MYDVFISYSRKDYYDEERKCVIEGGVVSRIRKILDDNGITYWFDENNIEGGDDYGKIIGENIENSKIFLFISTANSNESFWTRKEISIAVDDGKYIIPFRRDDSKYDTSVRFRIIDLEDIRYSKYGEESYSRVLSAIKNYLKKIDDEEKKKVEERQKAKKIINLTDEIADLKKQQNSVNIDINSNLALIKSGKNTYNEIVKKIEEAEDELYILQHGSKREHKPEPTPEPKPKPKTWLWILLIVVVLGGGFALYKSNESKKFAEQQRIEQQMIEQQRIANEHQNTADNAFFQNCSSVADYRSYLKKYPNGLNKELAKNKVNKHVADSMAKAEEARQRQIAADNKRKVREAEAEAERKKINGHAYVDLGLPSGLLWATCNVGANSPEDYGNYYAWGETTAKGTYNWSTYKYCRGSYNNQTKYNTKSDYGTVDNREVLEMVDDAARANWGGSWRMPTYDELNELKIKCTWTWTAQGGKNGYRVTGPNGKSIFLPAAGYRNDGSLNNAGSSGDDWSSSLSAGSPNYAYDLNFNSGEVDMSYDYRYYGRSVRPVSAPQN